MSMPPVRRRCDCAWARELDPDSATAGVAGTGNCAGLLNSFDAIRLSMP